MALTYSYLFAPGISGSEERWESLEEVHDCPESPDTCKRTQRSPSAANDVPGSSSAAGKINISKSKSTEARGHTTSASSTAAFGSAFAAGKVNISKITSPRGEKARAGGVRDAVRKNVFFRDEHIVSQGQPLRAGCDWVGCSDSPVRTACSPAATPKRECKYEEKVAAAVRTAKLAAAATRRTSGGQRTCSLQEDSGPARSPLEAPGAVREEMLPNRDIRLGDLMRFFSSVVEIPAPKVDTGLDLVNRSATKSESGEFELSTPRSWIPDRIPTNYIVTL